jgi:DNA-binding MarR family transcriptional regulator
MPSLTFHLKRAYFDAVAKMRPLVAAQGLTPCRIDLLHAVHSARSPPSQRDLRETLRVTSSSLVEMLRALEARGFVTRRTCPIDRRQKIVELTFEGRERLRDALRVMLDEAAA